MSSTPDSQAHQDVEEIRRAAERAAALTRQLLIFSRREVVKPELLVLGDVVAELENLLRRPSASGSSSSIEIAEDLYVVEADPSQIEQVLVNLAVNARDAMPDGGRLLIEAENVELDEEYTYMHPDTEPGLYVRLKVSDTGVGMDAETIERAFEPFFTTKERRHRARPRDRLRDRHRRRRPDRHLLGARDGHDGEGPPSRHLGSAARRRARPHGRRRPVSGEVVLVVEDEPDVRRMAERILTKGGYSVIGTPVGDEALEICGQSSQQPVDLLLTDVIMPEMLGTELVERVRSVRPGLPVIYMSGYSHEVLAPRGTDRGRDQRLHREAVQRAGRCRRSYANYSTVREAPRERELTTKAIDETERVRPRVLAIDDRPGGPAADRPLARRALRVPVRRQRRRGAGETRSEEPIDLALCDIQMPGESGLDLAEEIAREYPVTAVVLVTGVDDPAVAERAFELGARGYLVKPFWPGQLAITAMNALRRHELELAHEAHNRALEERIKMLMDAAPVPIYIKDRERRYVIANRVAHEVAGMEPDRAGRPDGQRHHVAGERADRPPQATEMILEGGATYEAEEQLTIGGTEQTFLTVKFPYRRRRGRNRRHLRDLIRHHRQAARPRNFRNSSGWPRSKRSRSCVPRARRRSNGLTRAIEMHDEDTGRHVNRMAAIAAFLGGQTGHGRRRGRCCCAPRRRCTTSARSPRRTRSSARRGR